MATAAPKAPNSAPDTSAAAIAADPIAAELLAACENGDPRRVRAALNRRRMDAPTKELALRTAAELGQAGAFEEVMMDLASPTEATLVHAFRWALRADSRRMMVAVLAADQGRGAIADAQLRELRDLEARRPDPDRLLVFVLDRLVGPTPEAEAAA